MPGVIVGVMSGWQFPHRRERCLNAWMREAFQYESLDAVFFLGVPQIPAAERRGSMLFLPVPNSYQMLPMKVRAFCQWALGLDWWDYLLKTDDDARLSPGRLLDYPFNGADYIGSPIEEHDNCCGTTCLHGHIPRSTPVHGVPCYASGNGYLLSRRAVELVAERLTMDEGAEDLQVGRLLREAGIQLTQDTTRFKILAEKEDVPASWNNWMLCSPRERE